MESTLLNTPSFHPTLSISLPPSVLRAQQCSAAILIHLPSGLFYDPYTAPSSPLYEITHLTREVELEQAVGWTTRRNPGKDKGGVQWWEERDEELVREREVQGGLMVEELLQAAMGDAIREKARAVVEKPKVRRREKKEGGVGEAKEEVSSLMVELNVDELLGGDGVRVEVPLHVRYHPPHASTSASSGSSFTALVRDILPSALSHRLLANLPPSADFVQASIKPPTLILSCPPTSSGATKVVEGFYSTRLSSLFPSTHSHLLPGTSEKGKTVLALSKRGDARGLRVRVPVPSAELLVPVRIVTLVTVLGAAAVVVGHLLLNVLPQIEALEKGL